MAQYRQSTVLHDCRSKGSDIDIDNELLIVEGESASKSVLRLRDAEVQAVLPMQGKPMNAAKATSKRVAANGLFRVVIDSLGAGWADAFDIAKVRYRRVVLLFDPDADGVHSGVLMSLFFDRWMPDLILAGRLFVIRPPLFELRSGDDGDDESHAMSPDERVFAWTERQLAELRDRMAARDGVRVRVHRHRGIGSFDATILQHTCLNPKSRLMQRITERDILEMKRIFSV